jgi:hypothetical protein
MNKWYQIPGGDGNSFGHKVFGSARLWLHQLLQAPVGDAIKAVLDS